MIYLDNAATTRIDSRVLDAMMPYLSDQFGNPGGRYKLGIDANRAVNHARENVASLIKAQDKQIVFTSGGSEANSTVFFGLEDYLRKIGKTKIIISAVEHDSVIRAAEKLSMKQGFYLQKIGVNRDCVVSVDELKEIITPDVGLVSIMGVNNETGAVNQVSEISKVCHANGALFHTDCVQAVCSYPLNVNYIDCDFLTMSAHKFHGCKGVGALYVKDRSVLNPLIHGGHEQEFGLRGGTENVPGIVAMGEACRLLKESDYAAACRAKDAFVYNLSTLLNDRVQFNGARNNDSKDGNRIVSVTIQGMDAETLVMQAGALGLCISAGSACRSLETVPSHVLTAMGLTADEAMSTIRVSFSNDNTIDDARSAAKIISDIVRYTG